jgi:hypothetical protein
VGGEGADATDAARPAAIVAGQLGPDGTGPADVADPPNGAGGGERPLPEHVRTRIVELAADALTALDADTLPVALRRVARFTPAKRARLAAAPLAAALEADAAFRHRVGAHAASTLPGLADAMAEGSAPPAADPVDVAVLAYLARPKAWARMLDDAVAELERAGPGPTIGARGGGARSAPRAGACRPRAGQGRR